MCGIAGFIDTSLSRTTDILRANAEAMAACLAHRGPDAQGIWVEEKTGIALAHRRLAIIDLSPLGEQPMHSADGRFVIVFNGEIYNFLELRAELETLGHTFRSSSDTEVMLAAFGAWGIAEALQRFNGMFAFALWDRQERVLYLARDRAGEKPLYYGRLDGTLYFASELKAIRTLAASSLSIDRDALTLYLRYSHIPSPHTIYQRVFKLPPGTFLRIPFAADTLPEPESYWRYLDVVRSGLANPYTLSDTDAIDELDERLRRAVKLRMIADVPLGAFLSGGIDSSTIVALMQAQSSAPVRTYTIGFDQAEFNEAQHARAVAQHLGTSHTELYATAQDALAVVPLLPSLYDEPFADSSQIPTYLVSKLTRQHVTVSLSGDAGDELFGGYRRYQATVREWARISRMPQALRRGAASLLQPLVGVGQRFQTALEMLSCDARSFYLRQTQLIRQPHNFVPGAADLPTVHDALPPISDFPDYIAWMMYVDFVSYLPDDVLVKVDRAGMGVALEGRIPLLDPDLIAFAWRLPMRFKLRDGQTKWALRQVLYRYVPRELIERPKMGFGVPLTDWLRGELRGWASDLLEERRLRTQGYFDVSAVNRLWSDFQRGKPYLHSRVWTMLVFQQWLTSIEN